MKYIIQIPTVQFGLISCEREVEIFSPEVAVAEHNLLLAEYKGGDGLPEKEFCAFLDRYLTEGTGDVNVYNAMNQEQQKTIQCIKRSLKRIKSKQGEIE